MVLTPTRRLYNGIVSRSSLLLTVMTPVVLMMVKADPGLVSTKIIHTMFRFYADNSNLSKYTIGHAGYLDQQRILIPCLDSMQVTVL